MAVPSTAELQAHTLKRGEKIRLVDDIGGHPQGSKGKIALANGLTWKRYWIRFPDGSAVGHVDHASLVRVNDYDTFLMQREREAIAAETAADTDDVDTNDDSTAAGASDGVAINGVMIPQLLLDRSASARVRLSG